MQMLTMSKRSLFTSTVRLAKKKKEIVQEKVILGRPSNNLRMGIVGLPNIGKSSLFNTLTNSSVPAENYPFCTIDPSEARVEVPDDRFQWLVEHYQPKKITPAHLTVVDIAGLVKGASQGAGLGNAFLSNVASVDAIYHLVRAFEEENVTHVEDTVNPVRDLEIIQNELRIKDEEMLERHLGDLARQASRESNKKVVGLSKREEMSLVENVANFMAQGKDVRKGEWDMQEANVINSLHLLTAKPMIYLCNMSEEDMESQENRWLPEITRWVEENNKGDLIMPLSVPLEAQLATDPASSHLESQLPKLILAGYQALDLIHYFTSGPEEVRAWTVRNNSKAPQAAGVIHTDFERGFIAADIMKISDLQQLGSEAMVRSAGKYYQKGKEYVMEDGDIAHFKFNLTTKRK
ncbi:GTP-binding protein YchF [Sporodiniella umbellata]|nr:GTP-binding protein YchF [Sporodiniella umbellata]